jgi:hypothetical protein
LVTLFLTLLLQPTDHLATTILSPAVLFPQVPALLTTSSLHSIPCSLVTSSFTFFLVTVSKVAISPKSSFFSLSCSPWYYIPICVIIYWLSFTGMLSIKRHNFFLFPFFTISTLLKIVLSKE